MLKVDFNKIDRIPYVELSIYSSLNPIPFSLKMRRASLLPETIYSRNLCGENFIEFRFEKETKQLYEITLVTVQDNTVELVDNILIKEISDGFFACLINEKSELEISIPIEIKRSPHALSLVWDKNILNHFSITDNCIIGVGENNYLSSVTLTSLNKEILIEIFGF